MESKSNKFLVGLICIIVGIFFVANEYFDFKMGDAFLFILGGAFLLLYHTKRKIWSLVMGIMVYAILIFRAFPNFGGSILVAMIFIVPGIIFMVLYFYNRRNSFLITGSIFAWFGVFIFLTAVPSLDGMGGAVFFITMGMAFFTMYLVNRKEIGKWPLFPAILLIIFGFTTYYGTSPFKFIFKLPSIIPIIFILLGLAIIIKTAISKK